MPKCKTCNGCLDTFVEEEAVYYYCFLCNKFFDIKTRKEIDLFSSVYLVTFRGKRFAMAGGTLHNAKELEYLIKDSIPDEEVVVEELPMHISRTFLIKELTEAL